MRISRKRATRKAYSNHPKGIWCPLSALFVLAGPSWPRFLEYSRSSPPRSPSSSSPLFPVVARVGKTGLNGSAGDTTVGWKKQFQLPNLYRAAESVSDSSPIYFSASGSLAPSCAALFFRHWTCLSLFFRRSEIYVSWISYLPIEIVDSISQCDMNAILSRNLIFIWYKAFLCESSCSHNFASKFDYTDIRIKWSSKKFIRANIVCT